jgi:hypothetical protein
MDTPEDEENNFSKGGLRPLGSRATKKNKKGGEKPAELNGIQEVAGSIPADSTKK